MAAPSQISAVDAASLVQSGSDRAPAEFSFTILIAAFGILSLGFLYLFSRKFANSQIVLRMYVVTIIVFGTLLVVSSSYATAQIAPVVGLFGTIAGYILGRSDHRSDKDRSDADG